VLPATPDYSYDEFGIWAFDAMRGSGADLLGRWASAPISEDYTYGVEIEFALHAIQAENGVRLPYSTTVWESLLCEGIHDSLMDYLCKMGMGEDWRWV
jgi:hypothetical protein